MAYHLSYLTEQNRPMVLDNPFFPYIFVMVSGLVAAVAIGSIAFFNSKRPAG